MCSTRWRRSSAPIAICSIGAIALILTFLRARRSPHSASWSLAIGSSVNTAAALEKRFDVTETTTAPSGTPHAPKQKQLGDGEPLIRFEHVSKKFELNRQQSRSYLDLVKRLFGRRREREYFWPLRDVSFAIGRGVTVGVIGENGSGKSTMLKLVSRILEPTGGALTVNGRVSALLELGAGFHPELTGRENIYLHASLLGLKRTRVNRVIDQIIEFADLGPFIDTPVKHYSSGMYARLGFAIAVYVEPEVLLVDEVLAVGDEAFQRRCLDAIQRLRARGVTILLVSHSLGQVLDLCDHCIWLDEGRVMALGATEEVIRRYLHAVDEATAQQLLDANRRQALDPTAEAEVGEDATVDTPPRRWGSGPLRITDIAMLNGAGAPAWSFQPLEPITIQIRYESSRPIAEPIFSVLIHKLDGHYLWASNTYDHPVSPITAAGSGQLTVQVAGLALTNGRYHLSAAAYPEPDPPLWAYPSDFHDQLYQFQIVAPDVIHGDVVMPSAWTHTGATTSPQTADQQLSTPV
ncbi:MAG: ABC transporter ATP-binding protein [Caldilineaceae bacterium]|nr:ABC transporter ATP-binding protein [Caldilineaceae bacterium]